MRGKHSAGFPGIPAIFIGRKDGSTRRGGEFHGKGEIDETNETNESKFSARLARLFVVARSTVQSFAPSFSLRGDPTSGSTGGRRPSKGGEAAEVGGHVDNLDVPAILARHAVAMDGEDVWFGVIDQAVEIEPAARMPRRDDAVEPAQRGAVERVGHRG